MFGINYADEMYVLSTSKQRVSIQLVGKNKVQEKLKRFEELRGASVSYLGVSFFGPSHELHALVPSKFSFPFGFYS